MDSAFTSCRFPLWMFDISESHTFIQPGTDMCCRGYRVTQMKKAKAEPETSDEERLSFCLVGSKLPWFCIL